MWAALLCGACTWVPLAVGVAFDVHAFLWWGVVSAYLGISWVVPGALFGAAVTQRAKERDRRHANVLGFGIGIPAGIACLVGVAFLLAAFAASTSEEAPDATPALSGGPAVSDRAGRTVLVMTAVHARTSHFGRVVRVRCGVESDSLCAVTYGWPACQLWTVRNVNGHDVARPLDKPSEGGYGTFNGRNVGCFWPVNP
jgi:hypothetical protein